MCAVYGPKRLYAEVIVTVFKTSRVAKRDDFHSKLLFFVKNKGQWNAKSGPKVADGNLAMRTKLNFRDVWSRNESVQAEIGQMLHTHTHTHAAKLVVEIGSPHPNNTLSNRQEMLIVKLSLVQVICFRFCRVFWQLGVVHITVG